MITLGIQIIIWIQPNDLRVWCEQHVFGTKPNKDWNGRSQYEALEKALNAIGIA